MNRHRWAALITILVGGPLLFMFYESLSDGFMRHRDAPLRSLIGDPRFEELNEGKGGVPHYLGKTLSAPDFELKDRTGKSWKLSDHRGKVVVLNFWSVTCGPCVEEMPTLESLATMAEDWDDIEVVAVSTDSGYNAVRSVLPSQPRLTHLFDPNNDTVLAKYGTKLYPETWIVDAKGVIRVRFDGPQDWASPLAIDVIKSFL